MQPSGRDLECFAVLASVKNVSRAAERLDMAQSSLSMLVKRLEAYFGTPLIMRKKVGVELTRAGLRLVESSKLLSEQWKNLRANVLAEVEEVSGLFTIGCHPAAAAYALPRSVAKLMQTYPGIELRFVHDLSRRLTEDVVSHRLDLAMVSNPFQHPDLVIKRLYVDKVLPFQAAKGAICRDVLLCDPEMSETVSIMEGKELQRFGFRRMIVSRHLEYLHELCAAGAGIALFPAEVSHTMGLGQVVRVPDSDAAFECQICLVYRPENARSEAARTLIKHLETTLKGLQPLRDV